MCFNAAIVSIIYPETAGKTFRESNILFQHTNKKVYELTKRRFKVGEDGEEEAQVFVVS